MAAVYYYLPTNSLVNRSGTPGAAASLFGKGFPVNTSIRIPFLNNLTSQNGFAIVTEVGMQNKETIQYFLTFDDVISYFHFGKGLGSITISGILFSDCSNNFTGVDIFNQTIANLRGTTQSITFGSRHFWCVLSAFTVRASAEEGMQNTMEFNLQMEIINHDYYSRHNYPSC
jgi:hypothetical protein